MSGTLYLDWPRGMDRDWPFQADEPNDGCRHKLPPGRTAEIAPRDLSLSESVLNSTRMHPQRLEGMPEHQVLGFGIHCCPLPVSSDPGPADFDTTMGSIDVATVCRESARRVVTWYPRARRCLTCAADGAARRFLNRGKGQR